MKLSSLLVFLFAQMVVVSGFAASICDDPLSTPKVCERMKNLRSHVMMLESQRDLMQLNYTYIRTVSDSLGRTANDVIAELPVELIGHANALAAVAKQATEISDLAKNNDPDALIVSNQLRNNCATCHGSRGPINGLPRWDDIFKTDWSKIVENCNTPGRNPFTCKQMHGLISNYSYILTAYVVGANDFDMTEQAAGEMARISQVMLDQNLLHGVSGALKILNAKAKEVVGLAQQKDPESFVRAYATVESCMACHTGSDLKSLKFSQLKASQDPHGWWVIANK